MGVSGAVALALSVAACGSSETSVDTVTRPGQGPVADLRSYVAAVERVRLPVNALLDRADPILNALHDKAIRPDVASHRMGQLERRFATYALRMQEIEPADPSLAAINAPYASTYFFEDSYLATLASDLREGDFDNLPDTQDQQRLAIVTWRIKLETVAARLGVTLPADLQQAGRGEIAPGPTGS
jgi:hypothetical protein